MRDKEEESLFVILWIEIVLKVDQKWMKVCREDSEENLKINYNEEKTPRSDEVATEYKGYEEDKRRRERNIVNIVRQLIREYQE
jgi:hypothetical protein